jgi:hypothetical protein
LTDFCEGVVELLLEEGEVVAVEKLGDLPEAEGLQPDPVGILDIGLELKEELGKPMDNEPRLGLPPHQSPDKRVAPNQHLTNPGTKQSHTRNDLVDQQWLVLGVAVDIVDVAVYLHVL